MPALFTRMEIGPSSASHPRHQFLHRRGIRDIGHRLHHAPAMLAHDAGGFRDAIRHDVVHHDIRAVLRQDHRVRAPHATAGAGNQRDPALQHRIVDPSVSSLLHAINAPPLAITHSPTT